MNKFAKGIVFGLGFGLGLIIIAAIIIFFIYLSPVKFGHSENSIVGKNIIKINDSRLEIVNDKPIILGSLTNTENKVLSSIMVESAIYDKDNKFIDKNNEYIASLSPKESYGFKIEFYNWSYSGRAEGLIYKVKISQGFDRE